MRPCSGRPGTTRRVACRRGHGSRASRSCRWPMPRVSPNGRRGCIAPSRCTTGLPAVCAPKSCSAPRTCCLWNCETGHRTARWGASRRSPARASARQALRPSRRSSRPLRARAAAAPVTRAMSAGIGWRARREGARAGRVRRVAGPGSHCRGRPRRVVAALVVVRAPGPSTDRAQLGRVAGEPCGRGSARSIG